MCVMYTLHEHALARQLTNVRMVVPKGVTATPSIVLMPEFLERGRVIVLFEEINYSSSDDAVNVTKNYIRFPLVIGHQMNVIRHDHIREDQKTSGRSCLVEGLAGDGFNLIGAEDR